MGTSQQASVTSITPTPASRRQRQTGSVGSGVIVRADGVVVTNYHVINGMQQIKVVLDPNSLLFVAPEADVTAQITTALNAKVPSVGIVPPQGWQPARESVQLFQEIQQRLMAAQLMQQRQQQQQQGNPQAPAGR